MRIKSFGALTNKGLDRQVNNFIEMHPELEIIDIKFSASFGSVYAAIIYR